MRRAYRRGEVLFFEGEPPEWMYVLTDGHVKLIKHSDDGRDIILHVAMPGDVIGGVAAFGRRSHPFTAQPMVPTLALRIAGSDFARIMKDYPDVAGRMMDDFIERLIDAHETMKSLATERVERRIARQLVKLAERASREVSAGIEITVPLSRQDVADIAGTTVETAIRVLSRWRRAGTVLTIDGRLVVADRDALEKVAEAGLAR
jgi:CRP/FNR family transcriptional regulator